MIKEVEDKMHYIVKEYLKKEKVGDKVLDYIFKQMQVLRNISGYYIECMHEIRRRIENEQAVYFDDACFDFMSLSRDCYLMHQELTYTLELSDEVMKKYGYYIEERANLKGFNEGVD
jgi:hypothetical protein